MLFIFGMRLVKNNTRHDDRNEKDKVYQVVKCEIGMLNKESTVE